MGKIEGTEASLGSQVQVQSSDHAEPIVGMQWETAKLQKVDKVQVGALAQIIKLEAKVGGPTNLGPKLGPLAMCHDEKDGRIAEQTKEGVGCKCDGSGLKKPVGKKPIGPTFSPKKLSSVCFEENSSRPPLGEVTNTIGPLPTQLISQGGKWTRMPRAAYEGKDKENMVNKVKVRPPVEASDSQAQKHRVVCNNGFDTFHRWWLYLNLVVRHELSKLELLGA